MFGVQRLRSRALMVLAGCVVVSLAVVAVLTVPGVAKPPGTRYAALGDSYAAGVGTGDYTNTMCDNSSEGYPSLWKASHKVAAFHFPACSGATTADVLRDQLAGLSASTTLVSLTIGGNDAGFSGILATCYLRGQSACLTAVAGAESYASRTLPGLLARTYAAIRRAAPNAKVVVLDYPHLYGSGAGCFDMLSRTDHNALDHGADVLDGVIATAVGKAGPGFAFEDVRPYFNGHGICSSRSWINGLLGFSSGSFHPTATGYQDGYLPALDKVTG